MFRNLIIISCIKFIFITSASFGKVLHVNTITGFNKIKDAVKEAGVGDTVLVNEGLYAEHSIVVDKPLLIRGERKPRIEPGGEKADIFVITSDSVIIEGFVLARVQISYLKEFAAIRVQRCAYATIRNNEINDCFFGIYLEYGEHCVLQGNTISGTYEDEVKTGNAIHIWKGNHIEVANNTVTGHRDGIYFEFVDSSVIHSNHSYKNLRYGLHFMFSNDDRYLNNEFRANGAGVAVMFSKRINMKENLFSENWGNAAYGMLLKEISDGEVTGNRFERNTTGIMAEGVNRITLKQNQFIQNGTAFNIQGNCLDNRIEENNFVRNTFDVMTNSKYNKNTYNQNYWSDYDGYDLDKNGIGDIPYRPVNLFAFITDRIPSATIMMHSTVVDLMKVAEMNFPEIIPEELIDRNPRMRPYAL